MTLPTRMPAPPYDPREKEDEPARLRLVQASEDPLRPEPGKRPWLGGTMRMGVELAATSLLCLLFFAGFLSLQSVIFPLGVPLRDILSQAGEGAAVGDGATRKASGNGLVAQGELGGAPAAIARLAVLNPDVKSRGGDEIAWRSARSGTDLHDRDGVITASRGSATVVFDENNVLRLGANTLIIVREPGRELGEQVRRPSVLVEAGELFATITSSAEQTTRLSVQLPGGKAEIAPPEASNGPTAFKITVDAAHRPSVAVYQGTAVISSGNSTVRVGPRQYTTLGEGGVVTAPKPLPPAPAAAAPSADTKLVYHDLSPLVTFAWTEVPDVDHYRLRVARDARLSQIVLDERVEQNQFQCGSLKFGDYHWQVSACTPDADGPASTARRFSIVQVAEGPPLEATLPGTVVTEDHCIIVGRTSPGAAVFISGQTVAVDAAGRFEFEIPLKQGANVIVVEARDAAGNVTYQSQIVSARY